MSGELLRVTDIYSVLGTISGILTRIILNPRVFDTIRKSV